MADAKFGLKSIVNEGTIFDDLKKVYWCEKVIEHATDFTVEGDADIDLQQLPITEDGVTVNFGSVNTTYKKLNTGEVWGSKVDRDDPECSFNVASVNNAVNEMFMDRAVDSTTQQPITEHNVTIGNNTFKALGYQSNLNAKNGSLWFPAENGAGWIVLPNVKLYGALNGTDDSNTAYFACNATPSANKDGASVYILKATD